VPDEQEVADLLARIDEGWSDLSRRIDALDDVALEHSEPNTGWPLRLVLAHFARWEDWHHDAVQEHLADGSARSYAGFNDWNEGWAAADRAVPAGEARERLRAAHGRLRALLGGLAPAQWDEAIAAWVRGCTYEHYAEHAGAFEI
jgi:hypothetical protein